MSRDTHRRRSAAKGIPVGKAGPSDAPKPPLQRHRVALAAAICAALVIITFAAFGGLLSSGFITYDDEDYVTRNTNVQKGLNAQSVAWAFSTTTASNWHPLTWLSHMLDVQIFGLNAGRHHLTSLLLHALNAALLFLLLFRMTGALWRSAFVAALFALHPLHVESVAWIAERKDVLSALFWLLTTGAWLNYVKSKKAAGYGVMLMFYALGLMAKPMLVTLPFTLLLLDYWPLQRLALPLRWRSGALKGLLWEKAPLFAMSAASCVVTAMVQGNSGAVRTMEEFPLSERCANAALAYISYLGKTFWPSSLAVFYPHSHSGLFTWAALGSLLLLAGATVLALRLAKRAPYVSCGWFWYLGTLVPVIGLVQVGEQALADRYTYLPLIGIFIAIAWGLAEIPRKVPRARVAVPAVAAASLVALFPVTRLQTGYWADTGALFEHALAVTSGNYEAHNEIGVLRFNQGKTDEAIAHYEEAVRIDPEYGDAQNNLGFAFAQEGRTAEAIAHYQEAIRIDPDFAAAHINLGAELGALDRVPEAIGHFMEALRIKPDSAQAMNDLGLALVKLNRWPEALTRFRQALGIDPDFTDAHINLGAALDQENRTPEAMEQYRQALRTKPDSALALNNLGMDFGRMNRLSEAIESFQQAVRIDPDYAEAHFHLGVTLAHERRWAEAQQHFQQALRIKPDYEKARAGLQDVRKALGLTP